MVGVETDEGKLIGGYLASGLPSTLLTPWEAVFVRQPYQIVRRVRKFYISLEETIKLVVYI